MRPTHLVHEVFGRRLSGHSVPVLLTVATVFCAPSALAQRSNRGDRAKAIETLNAATTAHGGFAAVSQITDTIAAGEVRIYRGTGGYEQYPCTIKTRGFDQLRTEVNGTELYISNGQVGWVVRMGEKERLPTHEVANNLVTLNPVVGILGAYLQGRLQLIYRGLISWRGAQFHHITAGLPDLDPQRQAFGSPINRQFEILIDAATSLIFSVTYAHLSIRGINPEAQHEYRYSDYRLAQGLVVPFRVEKFLYGSKRYEALLTSFELTVHGDIFGEP